MPTSLDWTNLRPLDNSQQKAFEELCVQLFAAEPPKGARQFVRKGTQDGGIEAYWELLNGDFYGIQAKFFRQAPQTSEWGQIAKSFKHALVRHPKLRRFTVCLPLDRADPKTPGKTSFMDHWNNHVEKWQEWARAKGCEIEFPYWGQSEIVDRLSQEKHRGRFYFWFTKEYFSRAWFSNQVERAIADLGTRYMPSVHVDVPASKSFNGLGRTPAFFAEFANLRAAVVQQIREISVDQVDAQGLSNVRELTKRCTDLVASFDPNEVDTLPIPDVAASADEAVEAALSLSNDLLKRQAGDREEDQAGKQPETYRYQRYQIRKLIDALNGLKAAAQDNPALSANIAALLLSGDAGIGKSHLICDIAKGRLKDDRPTVLLLGEQFSLGNPWSQILESLGLECTREEFLGALDAAGETRRRRAIILIDALNEGEGIRLWKSHLAGILTELSRYPWIGIALSVRTSYEGEIVPAGLTLDNLVRVGHAGFQGLESIAVTRFFAHYEIAAPAVPLLQPEFSNPLFLVLFCEGISKRGLHEVPTGLEGITAVFDFFLESINRKLSGVELLDYDPDSRLVQKAVSAISQHMAVAGESWVPYDEARHLINDLYPTNSFQKSFMRHLISEGLLSKDRFFAHQAYVEGVRFAYERFTDHQIAAWLLAKYLDPRDPASEFSVGRPLGNLLADEHRASMNAGLVSALAIQLPETIGRELPDLAPRTRLFRPVLDAMIGSLIWRRHDAFSAATLAYVNEVLIRDQRSHGETLQAFLSVASQPKHPYNARFLHGNLLRQGMAERDHQWSIFLYNYYSRGDDSITRILSWCEHEQARGWMADESLLLLGTVVAWFLTSSNRYLRDRATKALVLTFTGRLPVLRRLLEDFKGVNDPYVLERLLATAYGCSMRDPGTEGLLELADWCYSNLFRDEPAPAHILLRDYARGVIERALHLGLPVEINIQRIRPPYNSEWPTKIPTESALKPLGDYKNERLHPAQGYIYSSVMGFGDFARYIIGTNSWSFEWSADRLGKRRRLSPKERRERFIASLSERQLSRWQKAERARFSCTTIIFPEDPPNIGASPERQRKLTKAAASAQAAFERSLSPGQRREYEAAIRNARANWNENRFDLTLLQRYILNRVYKLGWTPELFGEFDLYVGRNDGRETRKPERMGKKYQWIAYHEILARVSDNFHFKDEWNEHQGRYHGPWQVPGLRDIDPSITIRSTKRERLTSLPNPCWWAPLEYKPELWRKLVDDESWFRSKDDLPSIQGHLHVVDPTDNSHWLTLEGSYDWEEPTPEERARYELSTRRIWYMLQSYIVRKQDFSDAFEWAKRQDFMGRWMPESHDTHYLFHGELFWAPAYRSVCANDLGLNAWRREGRSEVPWPLLVTAQTFIWEASGYDCSIDEGIYYHISRPWLADAMRLVRGKGVGEFCSRAGRVVARDPSVHSSGPSVLLTRPRALRKFLDRIGCEIFWTVLGEKQTIGGRQEAHYGRTEISGALAFSGTQIVGRITRKVKKFH